MVYVVVIPSHQKDSLFLVGAHLRHVYRSLWYLDFGGRAILEYALYLFQIYVDVSHGCALECVN